ncbi:MAG: type IX secretion system sortase PorU [Ignavibacteria bacterium]|jgi:hypothetical protein|nr:type IX secretion system sortase PorU [Ignavibacteria bacterium]
MKTIRIANLLLLISVFPLLAGGLSEISNGQWVKLGIGKEGIYAINAADLSSKGMSIPKELIGTIKLYGQSGKPMNEQLSSDLSLNEQEIIVNTNADGSLASIVFYGSAAKAFEYDAKRKIQRHYNNYYDTKNYYLLTYGKTDGKRAIPHTTPTDNVKYKPTSYRASLFHEEDKYMPLEPGGGLFWLGDPISNNSPIVDYLPNFNRTGNVEFLLSYAHTAKMSNTMRVYQGNELILSETMTSVDDSYEGAKIWTKFATIPSNLMGSDNRSVLKFEYSGSPVYPFHNFYEIHYKSDFVPIDNEITFFSDINNELNDATKSSEGVAEYSISGFNGTIYGYDVTDASNPKLLSNIATTGGFFVFRYLEKLDSLNVHKYYVASKFNIPSIEEINPIDLRDVNSEQYANADVIVITPSNFIQSATSYAQYRSNQSNYKVSVVQLDKIYAEFSYGRLDLAAIRNYIQYCFEQWKHKPQFVVLWGNGTYDFKGIEPYPNYIPAHQRADASYAVEQLNSYSSINCRSDNYSTDDFYTCIVGDDQFPDIAIGRVPIGSNTEGYNYIEKLDLYENHSDRGNWRRNALLMADDGPTTSNSAGDRTQHTGDAESIYRHIMPDFITNKVYLVNYPVVYQSGGERRIPKATEEIFNQLNVVGATLFFFVGHGNENSMTHERVFQREMIQQFTNTDKMFLFAAGSCEVGRFDSPKGTLSADIVLQPKAGAIASFAASRISGSSGNTTILTRLLDFVSIKNSDGKYYTLGEASKRAKSVGGTSSEFFMYNLLGDPCVRLLFPDINIDIDSIDRVDAKQKSVVDVQAMSKIQVKGKITNNDGSVATDFNGNVNIVLNEPLENTKVVDPYGTEFKFITNGATLNSSNYSVKDGYFVAEFIIPSDITFSKENSILYLYAASDDNRYAKGMNNNLHINGISDALVNDYTGPEITIKFDKESFVNGDMVSKNPLLMVALWDETAINTTGLGIGHKIEAWIDENPNPIDLTLSYTSSLTDPRGGNIIKTLYSIAAGSHIIRIRAWDIFNNYTDGYASFTIPSDKEEGIFSAILYPNPASIVDANIKGIVINYNVPPPIVADVTIFDGMGNEVKTINTILNSVGNAMVGWNGIGANGLPASGGTYYYRIKFEFDKKNTGSRSCEKFGALGVIRR